MMTTHDELPGQTNLFDFTAPVIPLGVQTTNGDRSRVAAVTTTQETTSPMSVTTVTDDPRGAQPGTAGKDRTVPRARRGQRTEPEPAEADGESAAQAEDGSEQPNPAVLLVRLAEAIDAHSVPLARAEKQRKDKTAEHRFTCPQCTRPAAAVAYASKKRVILYCDQKCGAARILAHFKLDRSALTGRPDLLASKPSHFRRIDVTTEPDTINAVHDLIADGVLPNVYKRGGELVEVTETGSAVKVDQVTDHRLRALLNFNTLTYRTNDRGEAVAALPAASTCATILTEKVWSHTDELRGVIHTPAIRPDGSILQAPGFDTETGLYLSGQLRMRQPIPDKPTAENIRWALGLLLESMLVDFPWVSDASRANYLSLLLTAVIRPRLTCPTPLNVITAPERGSGKSFLGTAPQAVFGGTADDEYAWPQDDAEMRKQITTILRESTAPVVVFDNVPADSAMDYPSFAGLLTRSVWSDRALGRNGKITAPNDRIWAVTGTNVRLGGDYGQRSVLIDIDPEQPRPDQRTGFKIKNWPEWVRTNRAGIVAALLILARVWALNGAETVQRPMRGFTPWAEQVGGILAFHGIDGFMGNAHLIEVHDEDAEVWTRFLAAWAERYPGEEPKRIRELRPDEDIAFQGVQVEQDWLDAYPKAAGRGDRILGPRAMGNALRERKGRFYGEFAVRETLGGPKFNVSMWKVVRYQPKDGTE
jgi:hypothetical protein